MENFSVMILGAGYGMRMRPLTEIYPKVLIPLLNVPLIEYQIYLLSRTGIREIVMNAHHLKEKFSEAIRIGNRYGIKIILSFEDILLGTGGGLKKASAYIKTPLLFLINGDTIADVNYDELLDYHTSKNAIATMLLRRRESGYSGVIIDKDFRIKDLAVSSEDADYMYAGIQILSSKIFDFIEDERPSCIVRNTLIPLIKSGQSIYGYPDCSLWYEIGNINGYFNTSMDLLKKGLFVDLRKGVEIEKDVWVENSIRYGKRLKIIPPVILGNNVNIGENVTIGPFAIIGDNCEIGKDVSISRSIVLPISKIHDASFIEDAVVYGGKIIFLKEKEKIC